MLAREDLWLRSWDNFVAPVICWSALTTRTRRVAQLRGGSKFDVIVGRSFMAGRQQGLWGVKPVVVFVARMISSELLATREREM